jgi:hypothetical protein
MPYLVFKIFYEKSLFLGVKNKKIFLEKKPGTNCRIAENMRSLLRGQKQIMERFIYFT